MRNNNKKKEIKEVRDIERIKKQKIRYEFLKKFKKSKLNMAKERKINNLN